MKIMNAGYEYMNCMGLYPIINLTLKSAKQPVLESAYRKSMEMQNMMIIQEF